MRSNLPSKKADELMPRLFLLPKDISPAARFVTLLNPNSGKPSRYLYCPERGICELTRVASPNSCPKSLLLTNAPKDQITAPDQDGTTTQISSSKDMAIDASNDGKLHHLLSSNSAYSTPDAPLFIATPMDPLFHLLPVVFSSKTPRLYLTSSDHFDSLIESSPHMSHILAQSQTRKHFERRLAKICDTVDVGDETMFRLSSEKLTAELMNKARKMVKAGLPASLEERFVRRALEVPAGCVGSGVGMTIEENDAELGEPEQKSVTTVPSTREEQPNGSSLSESTDPGSSIGTAVSGAECSSASTPLTIPSPKTLGDSLENSIPDLLRLQTALRFLYARMPPAIPPTLIEPSIFAPLTAHLSQLDDIRKANLAARTMSSTYSRKRGLNDEEVAHERAEKKRKQEEEEKRKKASESYGVRKLRKADVTGMKKMSDFFAKKPAVGKSN
ncbi:MAG: hypothetical protein M1825_004031 [Sarcosagium campestre]|nr:MAG: hypothetical protein M1825_004031 [Sarcosagium campestre]